MTANKWPTSEVELAQPIVAWLQELQWTVYQEVQIHSYGARADIVATQGPLVWIVEVKRSLSLSLLEQCANWIEYAHYVSAAVPHVTQGKRPFRIIKAVTDRYGVGITVARKVSHATQASVNEWLAPRLNRKAGAKWIHDCLTDQHQTFASAGNADCLFWSPFQETCKELRGYVAAHIGCTLKEAIDSIDHHYASSVTARSSIRQWMAAGKVKGLRYEVEGGKARLYPVE